VELTLHERKGIKQLEIKNFKIYLFQDFVDVNGVTLLPLLVPLGLKENTK